jgi:hypothetical protein
VDESSKNFVTLKLLEPLIGRGDTRRIVRRDEAKTAMRSALVVVTNEDLQHSFKVAVVEDEQMIQALAPDGAHPTLGIGVGHWRPHGGADDPRPDRAPYVVEGSAELGVSIPYQVAGNEPSAQNTPSSRRWSSAERLAAAPPQLPDTGREAEDGTGRALVGD